MLGRLTVGACACALLLVGCERPPPVPAPDPGEPIYLGTAAVDPAVGSVRADWTIRFITDATTADGATFLLAEELAVSTIEGEFVAGYSEEPGREGSGVRRIRVEWSAPAAPGDLRELRMAYEGVLYGSTPRDPINSISPEWIELGLDAMWHPVFEGFDQALVGELRLDIPGEWTVAASGEVTREGNFHVIRGTVPQVDFAFVASPELARTDSADVTVLHRDADPATVRRVIAAAGTCRDWLTTRYGALPPLKFVLAPRDDGGYARKNYVVLVRVDEFPAPALSRFICHELAHYWSSHASPATPDYWMTESFAELVAARHVRDVYGDSAYAPILEQWRSQAADLPPVWTDTSSTRASFAINYRKGPLVLAGLEDRIGPEAFDDFVRRYMTGSTRTTRELLEHLEQVAGREASEAFRAMLAAES